MINSSRAEWNLFLSFVCDFSLSFRIRWFLKYTRVAVMIQMWLTIVIEMSDSDDNNERSEDYCVHVQWPVVYTYRG